MERISKLVHEDGGKYNEYFSQFVKSLQQNLNPGITPDQCIEMLSQHLITRPVFEALFSEYDFIKNNSISSSMHLMIELLEAEGMDKDLEDLQSFYDSVRINVSKIDNLRGKQTVIKNLYEKFFKKAFPQTVEKLGTVYTPVDCVDFIIRSVDDILKTEFNSALTNENVHILDPFTGTGTFITRLLQIGVIKPEDLERKYKEEIHCNEIVLLAYYIADVNIESVYQEISKSSKYLPYNGICLTDTFQLGENSDGDLFKSFFKENVESVEKQKKTPIRVIIGNPPYSGKQKNGNDNNQNYSYPLLDARISELYGDSETTNINILYDSYIRAFRWASDRLAGVDNGVIGFITNSGWIEKIAFDGFRKALPKEFSSIYVLDLKGAIRGKSGEAAKREGQNVFDIMTGVAITILVKKNNSSECDIKYYNIGDYLKREEKLKKLINFKSILSPKIEWTNVKPNDKGDWINQRGESFNTLLPIAPEKKYDASSQSFFYTYSLGLATGRDDWAYNFGNKNLRDNVSTMCENYNSELKRYKANPNVSDLDSWLNMDKSYISWNRNLKDMLLKFKELNYKRDRVYQAFYRPFVKQHLYYERDFNAMMYQTEKLFPESTSQNLMICVSGLSSRLDKMSVMISSTMVDLNLLDSGTQCFPLYWYKENDELELNLFEDTSSGKYTRMDGVTDWILKQTRDRFHGTKSICKEDIFYYVYGLLHSDEYRTLFASDLKKSLPRIPIVEKIEDFISFSTAGRKLADLHLNYEKVRKPSGITIKGDKPISGIPQNDSYQYFSVKQMKFPKKGDKSAIIYNSNITIENIPEEAYEYIVNGKSAIEWIIEKYAYDQDKKSGIVNDPNIWCVEHKNPRYILDLLLSVIEVSCETQKIVHSLPKLNIS